MSSLLREARLITARMIADQDQWPSGSKCPGRVMDFVTGLKPSELPMDEFVRECRIGLRTYLAKCRESDRERIREYRQRKWDDGAERVGAREDPANELDESRNQEAQQWNGRTWNR